MIYVASDLFGYNFDAFISVLNNQVCFGKNDWLFILGNVIDKGPDGVKYLNWLLTCENVQLLCGNHEGMFMSCSFIFDEACNPSTLDEKQKKMLETWIKNGGQPTISAVRELIEKDPDQLEYIKEYLSECPLYETVSAGGKDYLLTHSGLGNHKAGKKISEYTKKELLWNTPSKSDSYFRNVTTVFGHTPAEFYDSVNPDKVFRTDTWIDIYTGKNGGRTGTILCLDDMSEYRF